MHILDLTPRALTGLFNNIFREFSYVTFQYRVQQGANRIFYKIADIDKARQVLLKKLHSNSKAESAKIENQGTDLLDKPSGLCPNTINIRDTACIAKEGRIPKLLP